ncbi:coiled-coil domain-containing protein 57 isoform X2 [Brienomyrus brachyistius]|uniref:coiled-coil domain-containing protein 57 isoform X2 n=1 Tax=Brienomyrus brachyistius TaxID=42636 RepID=UPI0020B3A162|nr:coiled-coil domain-containing protein 57 isoform X2 [Brienomyrus brachyistius]
MQDEDLEVQLAHKEKECKELQGRWIQQLEGALRDTRAQLAAERARFLQLREDFLYNLQVLEERDRQLDHYDAMAARIGSSENARRAEISELRIQIDKLQEAVATEARVREELQLQHKQKLAEHQLRLERVQSMKDREIERHREEYEVLKRELERRIQEVQGELALQKQEFIMEFDNELKRREREFSLRRDEMSSAVYSHELKAGLLSREVDAHAQALKQTEEALKECQGSLQDARRDLQRKEQEMEDVCVVKDARMKDLEDRLSAVEVCRKKEEEVYNRKHEELDRRVRQREAAVASLRDVHCEQLHWAEARARESQAGLDAALEDKRRAESDHAELLRDRDAQLADLRKELDAGRAAWEAHVKQTAKEKVSRDLELQSLGEREAKLRAELQRRTEDVERYRLQLSEGVQREQDLERARLQAELDWQQRMEDAKTQQYQLNEELVKGLMQARDQVTAELREKERELQEMAALLRSVTAEKEQVLRGAPGTQATAGVDAHGPADGAGSFPSEEIQRLQQQNSSLRGAIAQMRKDMESLSEKLPTVPPTGTDEGSPEYSQALEEEVRELKARCRHLEEQLEEALKSSGPSAASHAPIPALPVSADNAYLQNHICCLNETIGGLRVEKVSSAAALRKLEVRVAHLEPSLSRVTQQLHSKQVECDELRFDLANQKKRVAAEEAGLRQRLAAVEMELEEVKREAEEYQRGSLLQNLEAVALGNQVSALKLDIASRREPIVVEQSTVLQELQKENLHLRQQLLGRGHEAMVAMETWAGAGPAQLQAKLKKAVRCISQLSQDKQRLIEMGNRLRGQLIAAGLDVAQPPGPANRPDRGPKVHTPERQQNPLSALEQLQYQLTKQELQYAQREYGMKTPVRAMVRPSQCESRGQDEGVRVGQQRSRAEKENALPGRPMPSPGAPSALMSSLGTDSSLQDVWHMLEVASSLSGLSPGDGADGGADSKRAGGSGPGPAHRVSLQGTKIPVQERKKMTRAAGKTSMKTKSHGKGSGIRNYNIKD